MPDHSPADKPELPALPKAYQVRNPSNSEPIPLFTGAQLLRALDEREAWARADERRKALELAKQAVQDERQEWFTKWPLTALECAELRIHALMIDRKEPT